MKLIILTSLILLMIIPIGFAQKRHEFGKDKDVLEKFAQLEKIKLIEALDMDEETTLRFFSRRADFQKDMEAIHDSVKYKTKQLEDILVSARMVTNIELKARIDEIQKLQIKLDERKAEFINSLDDILTYTQIAKLIIFEKDFRDEMRKMIMKERKPIPPPEE